MFLNYNYIPLTILLSCISLLGLVLSLYFYCFSVHINIFIKFLLRCDNLESNKILDKIIDYYYIFSSKWFFDKLYNNLVVFTVNGMFFLYSLLDKGIFEWLGPYSISTRSSQFSFVLLLSNKGYIVQYLMLMYYGVFFLLALVLLLIFIF